MTTGGIGHLFPYAVGGVGFLFGGVCYAHLRRWVQRARGSRIVIGYKKKVVLDAPMTDWMDWAHRLEKDSANGRVVYRGSHVSVAVAKPGGPRPSVKIEKRT